MLPDGFFARITGLFGYIVSHERVGLNCACVSQYICNSTTKVDSLEVKSQHIFRGGNINRASGHVISIHTQKSTALKNSLSTGDAAVCISILYMCRTLRWCWWYDDDVREWLLYWFINGSVWGNAAAQRISVNRAPRINGPRNCWSDGWFRVTRTDWWNPDYTITICWARI